MIRFGILGAGNIAHRFATSLAHESHAELVAASCRTREKASAFLAEVPHAQNARAYGSYDELLTDPRIDAVYLSLPHVYHYEWSLRALRAGKAVLCEKPAMLSEAQMVEVAQVAREQGALFMEAMKPRFVPLYKRVREATQKIGVVTRVEATLCNSMLDFVEGSGTYHMASGPGAGVLYDCGIYCASWIEDFCPEATGLVSVDCAQKNDVDIYIDARLEGDGATAQLECAFDRAKPRTATLVGPRGRVVVDELHRPQRATLFVDGAASQVIEVPYEVDDFFGEIHHFIGLLESGETESPIMTLDASIACARLLDVIRSGFAEESATD